MPLRILTWNLFHGRSRPGAARELFGEFSAALCGWEWDVALLQEVPPWWPAPLGRACGASARMALTSRNWALPVRRAVATRRPELIKAGGGGANAILVRGQAVAEHRADRLRLIPERRVVHGVRLADGTWVSNVHAQAHLERRARADVDLAAALTLAWAGDAPAVLGGDFNLKGRPTANGFAHAAGTYVDHVLVRGMHAVDRGRVLDPGPLSDHRPVVVAVEPDRAS